jgi:hypothetical protein
MSGNLCYNLALLLAQHFLYCLYAACAGGLLLPYCYLARLHCYFAALHSSLYHGARCFSHLFGFALSLISFRVTTPAATASSIKNFSIFWALVSLSSACNLSVASNLSLKSSVAVCACQAYALVL